MILAAGRGERMRPLTDTLPKPLLEVRGKALILWHIERLAQRGFKEVIINIAHLGHKIQEALGDGSRYNVRIHYSDERVSGALESAGGIIKALPHFGEDTFLVVNGDVFCDYDFDSTFELHDKLAHLILVPNPAHNLQGDFAFDGEKLCHDAPQKYTFSGIAYYNPKMFQGKKEQKEPLAPLLRQLLTQEALSAELFDGVWHDIGTPERLKTINGEYNA